jgi:hypothetical protein
MYVSLRIRAFFVLLVSVAVVSLMAGMIIAGWGVTPGGSTIPLPEAPVTATTVVVPPNLAPGAAQPGE